MKRLIDLTFALLGLIVFTPAFVVVAILVKATSAGPVLYWSRRVGASNRIFLMPKFRTMCTDTPAVATHLLTNSSQYLTPVGPLLRKTSLDEIPQLWSVLKGDMSIVGPRPALFNQEDLIALRASRGVDALLPGLTGWAQVNGRDELSLPAKVALDTEYLRRRSVRFDLAIIFLTIWKVARGAGVSH